MYELTSHKYEFAQRVLLCTSSTGSTTCAKSKSRPTVLVLLGKSTSWQEYELAKVQFQCLNKLQHQANVICRKLKECRIQSLLVHNVYCMCFSRRQNMANISLDVRTYSLLQISQNIVSTPHLATLSSVNPLSSFKLIIIKENL